MLEAVAAAAPPAHAACGPGCFGSQTHGHCGAPPLCPAPPSCTPLLPAARRGQRGMHNGGHSCLPGARTDQVAGGLRCQSALLASAGKQLKLLAHHDGRPGCRKAAAAGSVFQGKHLRASAGPNATRFFPHPAAESGHLGRRHRVVYSALWPAALRAIPARHICGARRAAAAAATRPHGGLARRPAAGGPTRAAARHGAGRRGLHGVDEGCVTLLRFPEDLLAHAWPCRWTQGRRSCCVACWRGTRHSVPPRSRRGAGLGLGRRGPSA